MSSSFNGVPNNSNPVWWHDSSLRRNVFWCCVCCLTSVYYGYDGSLLNGLQSLDKFYEDFPRLRDSSTLGTTSAAQFLPGLIAPLIVSNLADRFGRKIPLTLSLIGIIVGAVIQCTSRSLGQFIASRVIVGMFGQIGLPVGSALLVEIAHPRLRSMASACNLSCYYFGSIIASWTTYGTLMHFPTSSWCWRLPSLLQALVPALIVVPTLIMPESPRWLVSKDRVADAQRVLANQHANGDLNDPLVVHELQEIEAAIAEERSIGGGSPGWGDFFRTKGNRWRLFILIHVAVGAQWNGVGIVSYYLVPVLASVGITTSADQLLVTGGMAISNLFFAFAGAFMVERMGRRKLWMLSTGLMLVTFTIVTALSGVFTKTQSPAVGGAVVAFLYLYYGAYDIAWTPLTIAYPVEVLPFSLRAKGMSLWSFFVAAALCVNNWVNPIALARIGFWYYIVFLVVLVYLLFVEYFFFPETKGLTLEEVAIRFDGHDDGAVTQANGSFHSREDQKVELEHDETVPNNLPKSAA